MADEEEFTPEELFRNSLRKVVDLSLPDHDEAKVSEFLDLMKNMHSDDEDCLNPDYVGPGDESWDRNDPRSPTMNEVDERFTRLEDSVRALLRKHSDRLARRMLNEVKEERAEHEYAGRRLTSVRRAVSFSKEELNFLIAVMDSVETELTMGRKAVKIADRLYGEFIAVKRNWEDEARYNGEKL